MDTRFEDMVFGFPEDLEESTESSGDSVSNCYDIEDEEVEENPCDVEKKTTFWETQNQLLQTTLYRSNSIETKVRNDTEEVLKELNDTDGQECLCDRPVSGVCRNCLRREVCQSLRNKCHDCTICNSKWRTSCDIPSGEHNYLEVIDKTSSNKEEIRIAIELNFRAEFEMARASKEYNQLIGMLPQVYVGKPERLREVIKILCKAAKKCMKEQKMHLGPWRRQKYMQAKWLGTCERTPPTLLHGCNRPPKSQASMLTVDLLGALHSLHPTAIKLCDVKIFGFQCSSTIDGIGNF